MLNKGIKGNQVLVVGEADTAISAGSGTLRVLATPRMAALMEETCWRSVADCLEEGDTTVGASLALKHLAPTPVGMKVRCESELIGAEGRKLTFAVTVQDEAGMVGEAEHERVIVSADKFQSKADGKGNPAG